MKMIVRITNAASAALAILNLINLASAQLVAKGCYSSPGALTDAGPYKFQSSSWCQGVCSRQGSTVMALKDGADCWCGNLIPSTADKVDDSSCSSPCQGYGQATCGGPNAWQVFLTGVDNANVGTSGGSSAGNDAQLVASPTVVIPHPTVVPTTVESKITKVQPSVVTVGGSTIVRIISQTTAPVSSSSSSSSSSMSTLAPSSGSSTGSKVGIAVGVVVGLVALVVIIAFVVLYLRRKKKQSSHQRVNSINGGLYHGGSGAASITDSRLDPSMVERKNSIGSVFADNEDYSRRILKVTNPDGR